METVGADPGGVPTGGLRFGLTHQRATAVTYCVAMFMSIMDSQIVNVALPSLARDFRVTIPSVQWVVTAYLMSIAVFVPASGVARRSFRDQAAVPDRGRRVHGGLALVFDLDEPRRAGRHAGAGREPAAG